MSLERMNDDVNWMRLALYHSRLGLGLTAPNPSVGCVLVKNRQLLAAARTADGGRPHAETIALDSAGSGAQGAAAYVTLEPCSHHGQTPPCADALIKAGIKKVVIGCKDEYAHVNGAGIALLKQAGIEVATGVLESACRDVVKGFFLAKGQSRPLVTLKFATTLDGKIATKSGESQWITGEQARRRGHLERSTHDAIVVGVGTVLADDPELSARLPGAEKPLTRIILDSTLRTPPTARILTRDFPNNNISSPVIILHNDKKMDGKVSAPPEISPEHLHEHLHEHSHEAKVRDLEEAGAICLGLDTVRDMKDVLKVLAERGVTRLLVEGGSAIHASFLKAGLYDRVLWFRAPFVLGGDGIDAVAPLDIDGLSEARDLKMIKHQSLGPDTLEIFEKEE